MTPLKDLELSLEPDNDMKASSSSGTADATLGIKLVNEDSNDYGLKSHYCPYRALPWRYLVSRLAAKTSSYWDWNYERLSSLIAVSTLNVASSKGGIWLFKTFTMSKTAWITSAAFESLFSPNGMP